MPIPYSSDARCELPFLQPVVYMNNLRFLHFPLRFLTDAADVFLQAHYYVTVGVDGNCHRLSI